MACSRINSNHIFLKFCAILFIFPQIHFVLIHLYLQLNFIELFVSVWLLATSLFKQSLALLILFPYFALLFELFFYFYFNAFQIDSNLFCFTFQLTFYIPMRFRFVFTSTISYLVFFFVVYCSIQKKIMQIIFFQLVEVVGVAVGVLYLCISICIFFYFFFCIFICFLFNIQSLLLFIICAVAGGLLLKKTLADIFSWRSTVTFCCYFPCEFIFYFKFFFSCFFCKLSKNAKYFNNANKYCNSI